VAEQNSLSRRALLATGLATSASGCLGPFSNGPDCEMSSNIERDEDLIYRVKITDTSNNVDKEGSCSRWTAERCLSVTVWIDTEIIDRIEAQTPTGELVAAWDSTTTTSRSESSSTDESQETASSDKNVFTGVTETPSAENPIELGPDVPDDSLGVYFELAALSKGQSASRQILFFSGGEQIEQISASLDC